MTRFFWIFLIIAITIAVNAGGKETIPPDIGKQAPIPSHEALRIDGDKVNGMLDSPELVIIDVRQNYDWIAGDKKIKGAERMDPTEFYYWKGMMRRDRVIVLYCDCPSEATSAGLALKLRKKGLTRVYALTGGWSAWQQARYPTKPK